jgi:LPS sulfotransferase NodH
VASLFETTEMRAKKRSVMQLRQSAWRSLTRPKIWLRCQQWAHQLALRIECWRRPHGAYRPVFLLATARSGSNLLLDYLQHLSGVACHSELLCNHRRFGLSPSQMNSATALTHIQRSLHCLQNPVRGCKLMLNQLANCRLTIDAIDTAFPEARYLVLYRQSLAEQFLSRESALLTGQWVLRDGEPRKQARVRIDPAQLRTFAHETRQLYAAILKYAPLRDRTALLSYEELTDHPAACLKDRICPLLGVPSAAPHTMMQKQNIWPLEHRVVNYRDVASLLHGPLLHQHLAWPTPRTTRRAA